MPRPDPVPLIVALLGAALVVRGLIIGSGSSPGGKTYRRDTQPVAYWTIMAAGTAPVIFLLHEAWAR